MSGHHSLCPWLTNILSATAAWNSSSLYNVIVHFMLTFVDAQEHQTALDPGQRWKRVSGDLCRILLNLILPCCAFHLSVLLCSSYNSVTVNTAWYHDSFWKHLSNCALPYYFNGANTMTVQWLSSTVEISRFYYIQAGNCFLCALSHEFSVHTLSH